MKKQAGFTLIELVVVIVILGILAVTAAPKFLNLQDDARDASLEGLRGAIAGAMGISYGRAAIEGIETLPSTDADATFDGIVHNFGYPVAMDNTGIGKTFDKSDDFDVIKTIAAVTGTDASPAGIVYGLDDYTGSCVLYTEAASATVAATVEILVPADTDTDDDVCTKG